MTIRRTRLAALALPLLAAAALAGCSRETATVPGAAAPVTGGPGSAAASSPASPGPSSAATRPTPARGSTTPTVRPTLGAPETWTWRDDLLRLDVLSVVAPVPAGWSTSDRVVGARTQRDRVSPDGSLLLRLEWSRTAEAPTAAVRRAAREPYETWPGYRWESTVTPMTGRDGVVMGGAEFSFTAEDGDDDRKHGRVATYSVRGWVISVYTSGPGLVGVRNGHWELSQRASQLRFTLPA
jgi:hypothetical protein